MMNMNYGFTGTAQLHLRNAAMQIQNTNYSILMNVKKQLSALLSAHSLYIKAKNQLADYTMSQCENQLQTLTVRVWSLLSSPSLVILLN